MLVEIGQNIWTTDGRDQAQSFGFSYRLRMCVVRLPGDALWVWSPIAPTSALLSAVRALGEVAFIVAPNAFHNLFAGAWCAEFPGAKLYAAPGVTKRNAALAPAAILGADPAPWEGALSMVMFTTSLFEEAVFFHHDSGTLIFTDILQQNDPTLLTGWRKLVARLDLMTGDEPHVPRKFRLMFKDKPALKRGVEAVRSFPTRTIVVAHGPVFTGPCDALLSRAFAFAD